MRRTDLGSQSVGFIHQLACCWPATERDDVTVRVLDIEIPRAPGRVRERLDDSHTIGDALLVERFDAIDARRGVKVLVGAAPLTLCLVPGSFFQMKFQSVQKTDGIETLPGLIELEADLLVVRHRTFKVVDEELRSEGGHARSHCGQRHYLPFLGRLTLRLSGSPAQLNKEAPYGESATSTCSGAPW